MEQFLFTRGITLSTTSESLTYSREERDVSGDDGKINKNLSRELYVKYMVFLSGLNVLVEPYKKVI